MPSDKGVPYYYNAELNQCVARLRAAQAAAGADARATCAQVDVGNTVDPVKTQEMFLFCADAKPTAVDRLPRNVSCGCRGLRSSFPFLR